MVDQKVSSAKGCISLLKDENRSIRFWCSVVVEFYSEGFTVNGEAQFLRNPGSPQEDRVRGISFGNIDETLETQKRPQDAPCKNKEDTQMHQVHTEKGKPAPFAVEIGGAFCFFFMNPLEPVPKSLFYRICDMTQVPGRLYDTARRCIFKRFVPVWLGQGLKAFPKDREPINRTYDQI
jgi:hypothetical protein